MVPYETLITIVIFRKWRQCAADKRFHREQKNALAVAALCSLSLGPPVHNTAMVSHPKTCYICFQNHLIEMLLFTS